MKPITHLPDDEFAQHLRRAVAEPDAPPALLRAAIGLWPAAGLPTLQTAARNALRRVVAALSFDSWAAAPLAQGMRSITSPTRHLLFTALGRDIDLRITREADAFAVTGQVLGPDETGEVELMADSAPGVALVCALDPLGEFRLVGVAAGRYRLVLRSGDDEIALPAIDVGEPSGT